MEEDKTKIKRMKVSEAARFLDVSQATLRTWHLNGRLVPMVHAITGHRTYTLEQLQEFLEKNSNK